MKPVCGVCVWVCVCVCVCVCVKGNFLKELACVIVGTDKSKIRRGPQQAGDS